LNGTLADEERERLKAEVVYWGLQQSQQGRRLSEEQLQAEFDRRLYGAQHLLGDLEADLQQEYDRLRAAEQLVREREMRQQRAPYGLPRPGPAPRVTPERFQEPGPAPEAE